MHHVGIRKVPFKIHKCAEQIRRVKESRIRDTRRERVAMTHLGRRIGIVVQNPHCPGPSLLIANHFSKATHTSLATQLGLFTEGLLTQSLFIKKEAGRHSSKPLQAYI